MRWLLSLLALLLLAGCAGVAREKRDEAPEPRQQPLDTEGSVRHEVDNRAVALLWDQAQAARTEGRLGDAATALERALQLAPEDPVLWSRLAEIRLRQTDFAVAENLAAKSNALAGGRRLLRYRNWLLIAEARARRGDGEGARKAREEAERIRRGDASKQSGRMPAPAVQRALAGATGPAGGIGLG